MANINVSPKAKAWLQLISLVIGTGAAAGGTAYAGGCNKWLAAIIGLGVGASNVYTALGDSPQDKADAAQSTKPL